MMSAKRLWLGFVLVGALGGVLHLAEVFVPRAYAQYVTCGDGKPCRATSFTSTAATGTYAYRPTVLGARTGIGPNANQYLYSDATWEARTPGDFRAEGLILGAGGIQSASFSTSNAAGQWTFTGSGASAATSAAPALAINMNGAMDANDMLIGLRNHAAASGSIVWSVDAEGDATVTGTLKPGSYATGSLPTCSGGTGAGLIAYDSTTNKHVGCNGTAWGNLY